MDQKSTSKKVGAFLTIPVDHGALQMVGLLGDSNIFQPGLEHALQLEYSISFFSSDWPKHTESQKNNK